MKASTVLKGLLEVKKAALSVGDSVCCLNKETGICHNLKQVIGYISYDIVPVYAHGWPEHSGCRDYPVPNPSADCFANVWRGEYGAARLRLLDYLIKRMEELGDSEIVLGDGE